ALGVRRHRTCPEEGAGRPRPDSWHKCPRFDRRTYLQRPSRPQTSNRVAVLGDSRFVMKTVATRAVFDIRGGIKIPRREAPGKEESKARYRNVKSASDTSECAREMSL